MSTDQMPPLPESPWRLHMPAAPHEPAWTSCSAGYTDDDMRAYARAYAEQEVGRVMAALDVDRRTLFDAIYWLGYTNPLQTGKVCDVVIDAIRARGEA